MKRATKSAFDSEYGFTSPGFTVDREGNLTATSFNSGTNQSNTAGARSGAGQVQITLL